MSTLASRNRVHCTRADKGDDMLVRGVRVPVAAEGREEAAQAVPEPKVQKPTLEYIGRDGRLYRLRYDGWLKFAEKTYPVFSGPEAVEQGGAVKGDEGE